MGRASNNGKITGSATQTLPLSHPINSTVRLELEPNTNLSSIQESNVMVSSNQPPTSLPINHPQPTDSNSLITTTNVILDYLLFLSINARIDQTKNELLKDVAKDQHSSSFPNKKGQGIEAIVEGLLQSHRTQDSSMLLPLPLKHRLYLCQLLHLVFDRSQIVISGSSPLKSSQITQNSTNISKPSSPSKSANPTINTINTSSTINKAGTTTTNTINPTTMTTTTNTLSTSRNNNNNNNNNNNSSLQKQRAQKLPTNLTKYEKHFKNALLSRCRKHRQSICAECQQHPSNSSITPPMTRRRSTPPKPIPTRRTAPGLIDAIPVFLNTCAITYRLARDNEPMTVKPMWYELLLDLLTQAAIECYLCDSYKSIDALLEVFSYGDIDPSDYHSDDSDSDDDDDDDPHFAATRADDYLLWQRTAYLDEFRQKKKERMEEFLNVKGKLEQHFENLANKYPIKKFETDMLNYCADVTGSLETPALMTGHKIHRSNNELSSELFHIPGRYYGGIDIPMSDDDYYDDDIENINYNCNGNPSQSENNMDGKKRRLSESDKSKEMIKKTKSEEISLQ